MKYVQYLHLLTLNVKQNYYKYMEQTFMGPIYRIFIVKNLCLLAKHGMWPLERFIVYHFKRIVDFYNIFHNSSTV